MADPAFRIVVGLGNPGPRYSQTRHNIGFLVIEAFARQYGLAWEKSRPARGQVARAEGFWLLKPETFMNRSGEGVQGFASFVKVPPQQILLIYDDLDLPSGRLRLRDGGGAGGHNGIRSVCERLGTSEVPRLRFGIGRPDTPMPVHDYVLQDFTATEWETVRPAIERACESIVCAQTRGFETAKNQFNPIPQSSTDPSSTDPSPTDQTPS